MRLLLTVLLVSATPAFAQLANPQLQTCPTATDGAPTTPWLNCAGGPRFTPISDAALVATGDFNQGTWRKFGDLSGETLVAVCPAGANLETETRCRTADGTAWATKFVRKDTLPGVSTWQITFRWQSVSQYDDGSLITTPVAYVLTWYGTDAAGVANTPNTDEETAAPPLVVTVPQQRICARLRAKVSGVLSDPSQEVCIAPVARKPGVPTGVTVEFGSP
jgi:hypothetical protein